MNHPLHDDMQWIARRTPQVLLLFLYGLALCCGAKGTVPATLSSARKAATCAAAPSAPTGLVASGTVGLGTFLNWTTVASPAGCTVSYVVFQNGTSIGVTTSNTSFPVTGLSHSTTYTFTVMAIDAAGNSANAPSLKVTTSALAGHDYFVAKSGSDSSGTGSMQAPWATIGHAVSQAKAGDTVYVRGGVYNESVALTASGTASAPIIIDGQGAAVIDGSSPTAVTCCTSPSFVSTNGFVGDSTQGLFTIGASNGVSYLTVEGFTVRNYTTSSTNDVPAGILIVGGGTGISVLNNTVQGITSTAKQTKNAGPNAYGIGVFGTSATPLSVTVSYNTVTGCQTGESETTTFNGNVQNFVVSYNTIHDNNNIGMDAIGFEGAGPEGFDQATNGDVYGNIIYRNSAINNAGEQGGGQNGGYDEGGLYCDGCKQVVFERNTVYANDIGIEAASETQGELSSDVIIRNNLVYGSNSAGMTVGGFDSSGTGGSENITLVNNSLYNNDLQQTGSGEFQIQFRATGIVFENNIVYAGAQGLFLHGYVAGSGVTLNNNDYYTTSSTTSFTLNNKSYSSFATYQSKTGQDLDSVFANPHYVALPTCTAKGYTPSGGFSSKTASSCSAAGNLDVAQSGSPALNAGNASLGTPSGSAYSAYQRSQPFVGQFDFTGTSSRVNANGQLNIGAYEN
jgi:Fibronectin type III domain